MIPNSKSFKIKDRGAPMPTECRGSILLVDDDLYVRELFSIALVKAGYRVDTAVDGADAWKKIQEFRFELLVTDYKMPRVTGLELIQKLRLAEKELPVILISGTMPTEELKRHPELQPDASLVKPFTTVQLLEIVDNVLRISNETIKNYQDCHLVDDRILRAEKRNNNLRHKILVVDDDNAIRQLIVDVLAGSGYEVEDVKDGAAGWHALLAQDYDLVVTDNKMPKMTGIEMIAKLRAANKPTPVLMATGILPTQEFNRSPWLKPDAMLQRPFTNDDLLEMVKTLLNLDNGADGVQGSLLPKY